VQNVTTYTAILEVANDDLKLRPGMTATVNIEIAKRDATTLVPNAALAFQPSQSMYEAIGQTHPPQTAREGATKHSAAATNFDEDAAEALSPSAGKEGRVWILKDGRLEAKVVRLGITDGRSTELLNGDLQPGEQLVTSVEFKKTL